MYAVNGKHATPNIFLLNIKYLPIILFLKVEVNSCITISGLANQRASRALFFCVVYTKHRYSACSPNLKIFM